MKIASIFFSSFFLFPGVACLVISVLSYKESSEFLDSSIKTGGKVMEIEEYTRVNEEGNEYSNLELVIEFIDQYGDTIQFNAPGSSHDVVGQKVEVLYHEYASEEAILNNGLELWGGVLALGFLGFSFSGLGIFILYGFRRKAKSENSKE
ncbi:DUF3592 domain-containing protein [Flammeovirga aprica]|uniref:DUF3592 domain-containing protein n=1 Tax=Flammeovirga aprica JL-4 TaxID=694437 RepID=A0A7X9P386_9BACT|nr:DUF3592 domain-containing protein [Flammeovirga aprica]NME68605.1 DUF3592 domain-containing protein [Flammeovirga aprica JL-4]